jgi:hypothetical protein
VKASRFWLKVEYTELQLQLEKILHPQEEKEEEDL